MDELDANLISALRHDSRRSVSDLAQELGVSRATIRSRLTRLTDEGTILGFTIAVAGDAAGAAVRAIIMIEVEGKLTDTVVRRLHGLPQIQAIHTTNGRWDIVAEIGAATLNEFDDILRRIRLIDGIATSETSLLLSTRKQVRRAGY